MSIGNSRAEQELNAHLARTLVKEEVLEPMNKIGWGHGTPPPPVHGGQPATEGAPGKETAPAAGAQGGQPADAPAGTPAPGSQPKADEPEKVDLVALFESLRDPETGLIAKKYKTVPEAIKGNAHLAAMAKQSFSERDELRKKLEEVSADALLRAPAVASPAAAPQAQAVDPPSRAALDQAQARLDKVLSSIAENGGVLDAEASKDLSKAYREVAEAAADMKAQENFDARTSAAQVEEKEWRNVDARMREQYPESVRFAEEAALHVQSKPLLAAAVNALLAQGKRFEATELAWTSFEDARRGQMTRDERASAEEKEADLSAREQVRKEKLEEARKDAGVVRGSAGGSGVHENANSALATREQIEAARSAMKREGDAPGTPSAALFRRLVIGPSLDPAIFGPQ